MCTAATCKRRRKQMRKGEPQIPPMQRPFRGNKHQTHQNERKGVKK